MNIILKPHEESLCELCNAPLMELSEFYSKPSIVLTAKNFSGAEKEFDIFEDKLTPNVCSECWQNNTSQDLPDVPIVSVQPGHMNEGRYFDWDSYID